MNATPTALMSKFDSKTLFSFWAVTATYVGLEMEGVHLHWGFYTVAMGVLGLKEVAAKFRVKA